MPLSKEGYEQLNADFVAWNDFRASRIKAMDRFAVADHRTTAELNEEDTIKKRIKAAYKAAKALAAKQKQLEKEKAGALVGSAGENPLVEEEEEDGDDSDSDEEDGDGDWEEREIKAAFESYAEEPPRRHASVDNLTDEDKQDMGQVPYASLRPALIQLMNRNIAQDMIFDAMVNAGYTNPKSLHVGMDDFRHIYQCVYDVLYPPADGDEEDDDMDLDSQQSASVRSSPLKSLEADDDEDDALGMGNDSMTRPSVPAPISPVVLSSSSSSHPAGQGLGQGKQGQGLGQQQAKAQGQGPSRPSNESSSTTKQTTAIAAAMDQSERGGVWSTSYWETPSGKATGAGPSPFCHE